MLRGKGRRAWLVLWDWSGEHAAVEPKVAAILPWQWSPERVGQMVEVLYASRRHDPTDMLEALRPRGHRPDRYTLGWTRQTDEDGTVRQVKSGHELICGGNPFLHARQARVWDADDSSGLVEWAYLPRYVSDLRRFGTDLPVNYVEDVPAGPDRNTPHPGTTGR